MHRNITRRDFLNGVALTAGSVLLPSHWLAAMTAGAGAESPADYYPPALTGLRGSHVGSFEVMHSLRDGAFWDGAGKPTDTGEVYDLVVVGGGISGLAAAHYFRKSAGPKATVLVLENHDDFGGHAKRNEFRIGNRTMLGFGKTYSIESPAPYSAVAKNLIEELGIDVPSFPKYVSFDIYRSRGLKPSIFFDKETFGTDRLVVNPTPAWGGETRENPDTASQAWKKFLAVAPLSDAAKQDFKRLHEEKKDYYPGLNSEEKKTRLARISYAKYLTEV